MATHGKGLICLAMTGERLDQLELSPMEQNNSALGSTAFTISIDAKDRDITTGISAYEAAAGSSTARLQNFLVSGGAFDRPSLSVSDETVTIGSESGIEPLPEFMDLSQINGETENNVRINPF